MRVDCVFTDLRFIQGGPRPTKHAGASIIRLPEDASCFEIYFGQFTHCQPLFVYFLILITGTGPDVAIPREKSMALIDGLIETVT